MRDPGGPSFLARFPRQVDDRMRVVGIRALDEAGFLAGAAAVLGESPPDERDALVFVHGFNVSFEEAALRAAQIGFDLQVPGITAFYSWPSKGTLAGYLADGVAIEASEPHLAKFLQNLVTNVGARKIHILAHSMGNRGLLRALGRIQQDSKAEGKIRFGQIVLAVPDVDAILFRDLAPIYPSVSRRTTLYISRKDRALASSAVIFDADRAGFTPPITVVDGIDTVEVSNVDLSFLGHGFFAAAKDVLHDIHALMIGNAPPKKRMGLRATKTDAGALYWIIGA